MAALLLSLAEPGNCQTAQAVLARELPAQEGLRRQEERTREQQQQLTPKADVLRPAVGVTPSTALAPELPCFPITNLILEGRDALRFFWLKDAALPFLRRCLGVQGISRIAAAMDARLIEAGYATSRVSVPQQNLNAGTLHMILNVGRVADVMMVQAGGAVPDTGWGTWRNAFPLRPGDILNVRDLEQGVEQMKRLPSQAVATRIEPGPDADTSAILIERQAQAGRVRGGVSLDNSGSAALGYKQLSAYVSVDNPLGLNDVLSVNGNMNAEQPMPDHRSLGWSASYSIPWGYHDVTLTQSRSRFAQVVQGTTAHFLSSGESASTDAKWAYLLLRGASAKTGAYLGVSTRRANSYLDDVELLVQRRRTTNVELGFTFKHLHEGGSVDLDLAYRRGMAWLGAQDDLADANSGGLTARPRIATLSAGLNQSLLVAGRAFQYSASVHGQQTPDASLAVDQFSIGSRYSVRGFDGVAVLLAESGFSMRNELSTALPTGDAVEASVFTGLDYGHVWGPSAAYLVGAKLAGFAVGARAKWKALQCELTLGTPLYKPVGFQTGTWNAYASMSYAFGQ